MVAIWESDGEEAYDRIHAAIRVDPDDIAAEEARRRLPLLFTDHEEVPMFSTLDTVDR